MNIKQEQKEYHSYLLLELPALWDKDDVTMVAAALAVEVVSLSLRLQADSTNGLAVDAAPPSAAGGASADRLRNHLHHAKGTHLGLQQLKPILNLSSLEDN